jgi:hypothetical protein
VTWGAFAVIQGAEYEELFTLDEKDACLVEAGSTTTTSPCCPPERPLEQTAEDGLGPPSRFFRLPGLSRA